MSAPGHAHAISIEKTHHRITVTFNGTVIADTTRAFILKEGPLPPAIYIPREDVQMSHLERTTHSTHCPFKGDASYYSVNVKGSTAKDAVWTYEAPIDSVALIKNYLSFYPEKMDSITDCHQEE
ncbi:DUF427 domain-containing protein [Candidatus Nitronereus thalassa]|uniref:DUF427 domain-containing protein n=1 Tax=Candidatus Nitronereus thalassa TaxID=3020898 RepID=A0ABU3K340_9BACT|nr:DUF427 domain-containing protein [Candidatus Nitronereus thalassa]MDT7040805.1 DUF427 domain-containing protein [Candidatus Nitronereus thalassa]